MTLYVKGTNIEIIGTLETLQGVATATSLKSDGSPNYDAGEGTKIWWDEQRTVLDEDGQPIWVDEDGTHYKHSQIEERDDELEDEDDEDDPACQVCGHTMTEHDRCSPGCWRND